MSKIALVTGSSRGLGKSTVIHRDRVVKFYWQAVARKAIHRLEVFDAKTLVVSARLNGNTTTYTAPSVAEGASAKIAPF
jgi:hypothetical protein